MQTLLFSIFLKDKDTLMLSIKIESHTYLQLREKEKILVDVHFMLVKHILLFARLKWKELLESSIYLFMSTNT